MRITLGLTAALAALSVAVPAAAAPRYVLTGEAPGLGFGFVDLDSIVREGGGARMRTFVVLTNPANGVDHLAIDMTADCSAKTRTMTKLMLYAADNSLVAEQTPTQGPRPFAMNDPVDRTLYGLVCEGAKAFTPPYESEADAMASVRR